MINEIQSIMTEVIRTENVLEKHLELRTLTDETANLWMQNVKRIYQIKGKISELPESGITTELLPKLREYRDFHVLNSKVYAVILYYFLYINPKQEIEEFFAKYENYGSDIDIHGLADSAYDDFISNIFYGGNSVDFFKRKMKIGKLLLNRSIPKNLKKYYDEIQFCYCYGAYIAALGLCRALLEISYIEKSGRKPSDNTESSMRSIIRDFNSKKSAKLPSGFKEDSLFVYTKTSEVLHGNYRLPSQSEDTYDDIEIVHKTFRVVETLYTLF